MFAVIRTGGKQYVVKKEDVIKVEKLDIEVGSSFSLDDIVFHGGDSGSRVSVAASVMEHCKNGKVIIFKKKRRTGYKRKKGHRQNMTVIKIDDIILS